MSSSAPLTVFVTGASGFVGQAVVRELLACGHHVQVLTHTHSLPVTHERLQVCPGSLEDPPSLARALQGVSAVIHLVGIIRENPSRNSTFHHIHVDLVRPLVDAALAAGVNRFVHMSALGACPDSPARYHQTKAAGEQIVKASSLAWTIFRPSMIIGPAGEFTRMLGDWATGVKPPYLFMPYFGAGRKYLIQPVAVTDVARAFAAAMTTPSAIGKTYDLVGHHRFTWPEFYRHFATALCGRPRLTLGIPAWYAQLLTGLLPPRWLPFNRDQVLMSQQDSIGDSAPFAADFGWRPEGNVLPPFPVQ